MYKESVTNPHISEKLISIITCEKLVSKCTRVNNRYQILTDVKKWYQIIKDVKKRYIIVKDVSDKTVKNWNRMKNAAIFGGNLSM